MAALDDLKAVTAQIKVAVDAAVVLIGNLRATPAGVSDADIEAVTADLKAASDALTAATAPPPAG